MFRRYLFGWDFVFHAPDDGGGIGAITDLDALSDVDSGDENDNKDKEQSGDDKLDDKVDDKVDDDENKDDDAEGDDDEDDEEKEEESEDDEENPEDRLTSATELKAAYPDIFKKFPDIKAALYRDQKYSELFGTVDDAESAITKSSALDNLEQDLIGKGNPSDLLDTIKKNNPESYSKVVAGVVDYLQTKDKDLYLKVAAVPIKQLLRSAWSEGKGKETDLGRAAAFIHKYFFNNYDFDSKVDIESQPKDTKSKREQELEDRLNSIESGKASEFNTSVDQSYVSKMTNFNREALDKDERLTDYLRNKINDDTLTEIKKELQKDPRFLSQMRSLNKQAQGNGYSNDFKSRLVNTALARAKSLAPKVRQRLISEALGKKFKSDKNTNTDNADTKKVRTGNNNSGERNRNNGSGRKEPGKFRTDLDILRS